MKQLQKYFLQRFLRKSNGHIFTPNDVMQFVQTDISRDQRFPDIQDDICHMILEAIQ